MTTTPTPRSSAIYTHRDKSWLRFAASSSLIVLLALASVPAVKAQSTWDGGANSTNLSSAANWNNDTAPANNTAWVFGSANGSQGTTLNNDFAALWTNAGITFNSGSLAYTINGNSLTLGGNIVNSSTALQTFGTAFVLSAARTITTTSGGGNFLFNGNISGNFGLTFTGSGTTTLAGNNSNNQIQLNFSANSSGAVNSTGVSTNGGNLNIGATAGSTNTYWNSGTNYIGSVQLMYANMATGANLLTNSGLLYLNGLVYLGNQNGTTNNVLANSGTLISSNSGWSVGVRSAALVTNTGIISNNQTINIGTLTAAGSGAIYNSGTFSNSGTINVGAFNGSGMNNLLVNTGSSAKFLSTVSITVGNTGSTNTLNAFTNDVGASASLTGLTIGSAGSSSNQVVNNGNLTNTGTITVGNGASGLNIMSNSASGVITNSSVFYIGNGNGSTGTNMIVNNGNFTLNGSNNIFIIGGSSTGGQGGNGYNLLTNNGTFNITANPSLTIGKAGNGTNQLALGGGNFTTGNQFTLGSGNTGVNLITVSAGATGNFGAGTIGGAVAGYNAITNAGTLTFGSGVNIGNATGGTTNSTVTNAFVQNGGSSSFANFQNYSLNVGLSGAGTNVVNTVTINGGVMTLGGNLRVGPESGTSTGTNIVTLAGGTLVINGTYSLMAGSNNTTTNSFVWTGGTLSAANINTTNGGWSTALAGSSIANGTLYNTNSGNLLVGNNATGFGGKTAITGNYTQSGSATTTFDLYGSTVATTWTGATNQYSQLTVSGNAIVGGNIVLNFGGFSTATNTYNIITSTGLSGSATLAGANAVNGYAIAGDGFSLMTLATNGSTLVVTNSGLRNEWNAGTATWDSSTNLWSQGINPGTNNGRGAYFGTNANGGTVTLADNKTISSLVFSNASAGYILASSGTPTITLGNTYGSTIMNYAGSHTVTPAISLVTNLLVGSSGTLTLAGNISGNASVTATNGGLTVLAGSNSYTGATTIGSGAVDFQNTNALYGGNTNSWTAVNLSAKSGGALIFGVGGAGGFTAAQISQLYTTLTNSSATVGLAANSYFGLDASGTNFRLNDTITNFTNSANGALGLASVGSGTMTLSASNSYTGGTLLRGGTIAYSNVNAFGTGTITATNSASISDVVGTGNNTLARAITVASGSTLTVNATQYTNVSAGSLSNVTTMSGTINGGGTLNIVGAKSGNSYSAAYLTGTSTSLGSLVLSNVVLNYQNNAISTNITLNNAEIAGGNAANYTLGAAGSVITLGSGGGSLKMGGSSRTLTVSSTITGSGDLYITRDDGAVQLNAANTYTGRTILGDTTFWNWNSGINYYLILGNNNALSTNGLVMNNGTTGRLKMNGYNATVAYISGSSGQIQNINATTNSTLTVTPNGTNAVYAGTIIDGAAGTLALTVNGSGTQTLSGSNSYSGGTTLNAGTLALGNSNALGTGALTFASNSALAATTTMRLTNNATIGSDATATYAVAANTTLTNAGTITGSGGSLAASGSGTLVLTASNSYAGTTTVNGGTLVLGNANALGAATNSLNNNATLNLNGNAITVGSLAGNGSGVITNGNSTGVTLNLGGNNMSTTYAGTITSGTGLIGLTKIGSGTTILSGINTYTGVTTVNGGTLALTARLNGTTAVTVNSGSSLLIGQNGGITNSSTLTLNGGTLQLGTSGLRVGTQSFSSLTLTADSAIDFTSLAGNSSITFGSITGLSGNKLSIYNWSNTDGNSTKLFSTAGLTAPQLGNISFYSGGLGSSSFLGIGGFAGGGFSGGEIVPVPEPGVVIAAVMLLGWLLISNRGALLALVRRRSA